MHPFRRTPPDLRDTQPGRPPHVVPGGTHPPSRQPTYFEHAPSERPSEPVRVVVHSPTPLGPGSPLEPLRRLTPTPSEIAEHELGTGIPRVRIGRSPPRTPTIVRVPTQEPLHRPLTPTTVRTRVPSPVERVRVPGRTPSRGMSRCRIASLAIDGSTNSFCS